jgi:hypothetical protein
MRKNTMSSSLDGARAFGTVAPPSAAMLTPVDTAPDVNCCHEMQMHDAVFRAAFESRLGDFQSLSWRDCRIEQRVRFTGAVIRGSVLLERIKGGYLSFANIPVEQDFTVLDSEFLGEYQGKSFEATTDSARNTLFERTRFGRHAADVVNAGGNSHPERIQRNQQMVFRECDIPHLKASWVRSLALRIERCVSTQKIDLSYGRIGTLTITGSQCARLDLRFAQIGCLEIIGSTMGAVDRGGAQIGEEVIR